jgi:ribosomal protein S12 methylthiotransferase
MAIRTTFIAGSPGETDAQHKELVKFVKDFGFEMMGVFPFSAEHGTAMGRMADQISDELKNARVEELMLTQQQVAFKKAKSMIGQSVEVMIERAAGRDLEDGYVGRSQSQAPEIDSVVHIDSHAAQLHPGQMITVKVTDYQNYDLVAEVPKKKSRALQVVTA